MVGTVGVEKANKYIPVFREMVKIVRKKEVACYAIQSGSLSEACVTTDQAFVNAHTRSLDLNTILRSPSFSISPTISAFLLVQHR